MLTIPDAPICVHDIKSLFRLEGVVNVACIARPADEINIRYVFPGALYILSIPKLI